MTDFEIFIRQNGIKKKEIAQFFGSSAQFVSQLCSGARSLPHDKFALLKQNTKGWDVSMLTGEGSIIAGNNNGGDAVVNIGRGVAKPSTESTRMAVLEKENEMLREQLKDKEAQIDFLRELVKNNNNQ